MANSSSPPRATVTAQSSSLHLVSSGSRSKFSCLRQREPSWRMLARVRRQVLLQHRCPPAVLMSRTQLPSLLHLYQMRRVRNRLKHPKRQPPKSLHKRERQRRGSDESSRRLLTRHLKRQPLRQRLLRQLHLLLRATMNPAISPKPQQPKSTGAGVQSSLSSLKTLAAAPGCRRAQQERTYKTVDRKGMMQRETGHRRLLKQGRRRWLLTLGRRRRLLTQERIRTWLQHPMRLTSQPRKSGVSFRPSSARCNTFHSNHPEVSSEGSGSGY
mmetsp:Transcript_70418/g.146671  ORF Transcript_70418/g.146671 Transcript_70418/m.146671 type:complete len:270 (+) Transcript_70418:504-1313(+)